MAFALALDLPAGAVGPPALVAPAPREVSFGRIAGTVGAGTTRVVVVVNGTKRAEQAVHGRRFELTVSLPPRDSTVRVVALDLFGNHAAASVRRVFGLPPAAAPRPVRAYEDPVLAREVRALAESFPGVAGVYVENLGTGAGAAWNAAARFPAASTLKLAIAIELLRVLAARPPPGSSLDRLLRLMLVYSDNAASNELLTRLGGSERGGAAAVDETMRRLGLADSHMFGGYLVSTGARPSIPVAVESQPSFSGKYTSASNLSSLHRFVHLATAGLGPLVGRLPGSFTASDARFLLYLLVHSADHGKLDRFVGRHVVVPHKAGWVSDARHDSGLLYSPGGAFVVSVMTWNDAGVGEPSDVLAGRVAREALDRFREAARAGGVEGAVAQGLTS